jgi:curved DNA-binding protein
MSVSPAGKFNDHYAILGIDSSADTDIIERAYAKMVGKYGPANIDFRDDEKFGVIQVAYETLSNPELRKEFDALKGLAGDHGRPMFVGVDFFEVLGREIGLRSALLCILYDRRRTKPATPALSMRHVEAMLEAPLEALTFALWYVKQRGYVANDDKSNMQITVEGMDYLEGNRPKPEDVMPFIKPAAISGRRLPAKPSHDNNTIDTDSMKGLLVGAASQG